MLKRLLARVRAWMDSVCTYEELLREMNSMTERDLNDIGLTRADVYKIRHGMPV